MSAAAAAAYVPKLSRLPKAIRPALNLRKQTPGTIENLQRVSRHVLEPSHPAVMQKRNTFPMHNTPYYYVKIYPKGLLEPFPHGLGPAPKKAQEGRVGMSVNFLVVKKNTHKSACVRRRMVNKLKTALNMVVVRGADARDGKLVFNEQDGGQKWIMSDWTYIFFPAIESYQAPYTELVPALRKTLGDLRDKASKMQRRWSSSSSSS